MKLSSELYRAILDSVTEHIAVIDQDGKICYVNSAWEQFGEANNCHVPSGWEGISYLGVCDASAGRGDSHGSRVSRGARAVISGDLEVFYHEYPCHSPTEKRWFMMRITPIRWAGDACFVVSHQNITERRLAEDRVRALSLEDGLTGIANRRHFNQFLSEEWRRGMRMGVPISMILIDVDHFKLYNDRYGHQAGDDCLKSIAKVLKEFSNRSTDLCARYGGEEFALVMANIELPETVRIAGELLDAIQDLAIQHDDSEESVVTASLGVASRYPPQGSNERELIEAADRALYAAKEGGRNRVSVFDEEARHPVADS